MKGRFLFASLASACLALSVLSSTNRIFFVAGFCYWIIRCFFLREPKTSLWVASLSLCTLLFVGFFHLRQKTHLSSTETSFLVRVDASQLKVDGDRLQFYGEVLSSKKPENIVVFHTFSSPEEKETWLSTHQSRVYQIEGQLKKPEPATSATAFDYARFLNQKKVYWILEAEHFIEGPYTDQWMQRIRDFLLTHIRLNIPGRTGIYIQTLFFGDKRAFGSEHLDSYRTLGLIHLLSISGMHVYFLSTVCRYICLRIGLTKERTVYVVLAFLLFYGGLLGWGVSIFRAVCQKVSHIYSETLKLNWTPLDGWAIALLLSIWIQPLSLFDAGYQLSYSLSFILLFLSQSPWFQEKSKTATFFLATLLLFLLSVPILSYHFFEIQWIGVFLNMISIPFFTLVLMPLFLGIFLLSFVPGFPVWSVHIVHILNKGLHFIENTAFWLSSKRIGSFITGRLPAYSYVGLLFLLIVLVFLFETYKQRFSVPLLVVFVLLLQTKRWSPVGTVTMVDMGQSEAIVIQEPKGKGTYMIDVGGVFSFPKEAWQQKENPYSVGKSVLIPYLKSQGIACIDEVMLTHSDIDHTGSLAELVEAIQIKAVRAPLGTWNHHKMEEMRTNLKENGVKMSVLSSGNRVAAGSTRGLLVLAPHEEGDGENNDSLVLYGQIGHETWLFTGDIEKESEMELIKRYPSLRVDVLKVAHHGSQTSTQEAFLEQVKPRIALISHGAKNLYGHPHQEVLDRLKEKNVAIYQTGEHGSITYTYTNQKSSFKLEKEALTEINN